MRHRREPDGRPPPANLMDRFRTRRQPTRGRAGCLCATGEPGGPKSLMAAEGTCAAAWNACKIQG